MSTCRSPYEHIIFLETPTRQSDFEDVWVRPPEPDGVPLALRNEVLPTLDPHAKAAMGTLFLDWRRTLYPDWAACRDTADDPEELYVRVLEVLEKTIRQLQGR